MSTRMDLSYSRMSTMMDLSYSSIKPLLSDGIARKISVDNLIPKMSVDNLIPLCDYYQIADNLLKQATIYREEKNIIDLFMILLRYLTLVYETIQFHRDYLVLYHKERSHICKLFNVFSSELETLTPEFRRQMDELKKDKTIKAAIRIAERKLKDGDFEGTKKLALRVSKYLFPQVNKNISQLLTVCEIHCAAAQKNHSGREYWYGILQVDQVLADESSIKKQYRKLALLLHPDKNKFTGAEEAFKLIGEASAALLDSKKNKR